VWGKKKQWRLLRGATAVEWEIGVTLTLARGKPRGGGKSRTSAPESLEDSGVNVPRNGKRTPSERSCTTKKTASLTEIGNFDLHKLVLITAREIVPSGKIGKSLALGTGDQRSNCQKMGLGPRCSRKNRGNRIHESQKKNQKLQMRVKAGV